MTVLFLVLSFELFICHFPLINTFLFFRKPMIRRLPIESWSCFKCFFVFFFLCEINRKCLMKIIILKYISLLRKLKSNIKYSVVCAYVILTELIVEKTSAPFLGLHHRLLLPKTKKNTLFYIRYLFYFNVQIAQWIVRWGSFSSLSFSSCAPHPYSSSSNRPSIPLPPPPSSSVSSSLYVKSANKFHISSPKCFNSGFLVLIFSVRPLSVVSWSR